MNLRLLSFNIRNSNGDRGKINDWNNRKWKVISLIKKYDPDVIGFQEVLYDQLLFLKKNLPEYDCVGVGRRDGDKEGEFVPIFYKSKISKKKNLVLNNEIPNNEIPNNKIPNNKIPNNEIPNNKIPNNKIPNNEKELKLAESGHFWLSDTPDICSNTWNRGHCYRMCTWCILEMQNNKKIAIFNTHLEVRKKSIRLKSIPLIIRKIDQYTKSSNGMPLVLMGDMNYGRNSEEYKIMSKYLIDSLTYNGEYYDINQKKFGNFHTFHDFTGLKESSHSKNGLFMIDYIYLNEKVKIKYSKIIYENPPINSDAKLDEQSEALSKLQESDQLDKFKFTPILKEYFEKLGTNKKNKKNIKLSKKNLGGIGLFRKGRFIKNLITAEDLLGLVYPSDHFPVLTDIEL